MPQFNLTPESDTLKPHVCVTHPHFEYNPNPNLPLLGAVLSIGVLNRITFPAFALPSVLLVLSIAYDQPNKGVKKTDREEEKPHRTRLVALFKALLEAFFGFFLTGLVICTGDSLYFGYLHLSVDGARIGLNDVSSKYATMPYHWISLVRSIGLDGRLVFPIP